MTRETSLLSSNTPTAIAAAPDLNIAHVQLRDLVICPRERGLVNYVTRNSVVEQDLYAPRSTPRSLFDLSFFPANITSLEVLGGAATLLAAGGQDAELHLSLHHHSTRQRRTGAMEWKFEEHLQASINNSILLTSLNLGKSNESSLEPRLAISNNDCTVKFFDIPMTVRGGNAPKIRNAGSVRLNVAVNHSSISPDGTCLLSVGDSSKVFLHRIHGGGQLSFSPIATLNMPPPDRNLLSHFSSSLAASFSTAFSRDGTKYAVASQEGVVCVWDVRSTKPLKVYQTDKSESWNGAGNGFANGYLSDDPYEWTRGLSKAPGWSARNVKFGSGGVDGCGKEIMTFTEHTSRLHVIDARTFEIEEIIRVPSIPTAKHRTSHSTTTPTSSIRHTISPRASQTRSRSSYGRPYQRPASSSRALASSIGNAHSRSTAAFPIPVSATSYISGSSHRHDSSQSPYVFLALEDTFRIPTTVSDLPEGFDNANARPWRRGGEFEHLRDSEEDSLVVIPPLGDREVEDDVRALLGSHGIRSRRVGDVGVGITDHGDTYENHNRDERMEVDDELDELEMEPEWDCISSHVPSRSSSPGPSLGPSLSNSRWRSWSRVEELSRIGSRVLNRTGSADGTHMGEDGVEDERDVEGGDYEKDVDLDIEDRDNGRCSPGSNTKYNPDLDIAGTCFDPSGGYIYTATTEGVIEWNVRGSDKRWWSDSGDVWC